MSITEEFWKNYQIQENDIESLFNFLFETERPLNSTEVTEYLIKKITTEQQELAKQEQIAAGKSYLPKDKYTLKQKLVFVQLNNAKGEVFNVRKGNNPQYPDLEVIDVRFKDGQQFSFASNLELHKLNDPIADTDNPLLNDEIVTSKYGQEISAKVTKALSENSDLVCIAGNFFPRALLVDIGIGHLNLAEAVLEMNNGGPLTTRELLEQIEFPKDVNAKLTEFSLDYAFEVDERFDEVGPAGETLWFLNRLEPEGVQTKPLVLQYHGNLPDISENPSLALLSNEVCDELELVCLDEEVESITLSLSYPHWRAGTLPLTNQVKRLFPTAFETPRVKFRFRDGHSNEIFDGWVVRPNKYIYGLREWYLQNGLIPGSIVTIKNSNQSGEVIVQVEKSRNNKDWIRTVLVGADGGVVFALLKQVITCTYDDRMAIMVTDVAAIDGIWTNVNRNKISTEKSIQNIMRELSKLTPQGQIHAQELYAAVNVIRRVPPSVILTTLLTQEWSKHLGDLYFRYEPKN